MATETYALAMPAELVAAVRRTATATGLSMADAMRQSIELGLPKLQENLSTQTITPMTEAECRQCWEEPDPEFDALAAHCAALQAAPQEE